MVSRRVERGSERREGGKGLFDMVKDVRGRRERLLGRDSIRLSWSESFRRFGSQPAKGRI